MTAEPDDERMRRTLAVIATDHMGLTENDWAWPLRVVDAAAAESPVKARAGLRMALGDLVEMFAHHPPAEIAEFDRRLADAGAMTVGEMRAHFSRRLNVVLKRGRIATEADYHLVRNACEFADAERTSAMLALLADYERRSGDARP